MTSSSTNPHGPKDGPLNTNLFVDVTEETCPHYAHLAPHIAENTRAVKERAELEAEASALRPFALYRNEELREQLDNLVTCVSVYKSKIDRLKKCIQEKDELIRKLEKYNKSEQESDFAEIKRLIKKPENTEAEENSLDVVALLEPYVTENARVTKQRNDVESEVIRLRELIDKRNHGLNRWQHLKDEIKEKDEMIKQLEENMQDSDVTDATESGDHVEQSEEQTEEPSPEVEALLKPYVAENHRLADEICRLRSEILWLKTEIRHEDLGSLSRVYSQRHTKEKWMLEVQTLEREIKAKDELIHQRKEFYDLKLKDFIDTKKILSDAKWDMLWTEKYRIDVSVLLKPYVAEKIEMERQTNHFESEVLELREFMDKTNQEPEYMIFDPENWKCASRIEWRQKMKSLEEESKKRSVQIKQLKQKQN